MVKKICKIKFPVSNSKGFTLIEIIVVMAILGILAATLVAVINPGEQIRKANDSNLKTSAVEFRNSILRYAAARNAYPWEVAGGDCLDGITDPAGVQVANTSDCTDALINAGEVSSSIADKEEVKQGLYVTEDNSSVPTKLMVCYKPTAKGNIDDLLTKFTSNGQSTCTVGSGDCYWCAY